jgi:putative transposase
MIAFIDDHREAYGVEPICRILPIAPCMQHAVDVVRDGRRA